MKAIINSEKLKNAISKIQSVADKKNSRPILAYTLVTFGKNIISFIVTDIEISCKITIPGNVEKEGSFCVNAKNINDVVKELPNDSEVELEILDLENTLKVNCQSVNYSLLINKGEDFPLINFSERKSDFLINSYQVCDFINKTQFAISSDETRINTNGIFLQDIESKLRTVAVDGRVLAMYEIEYSSSKNEHLQNGIIVPKKGVYELKKMSESFPEAHLSFSVDENFLNVNFDKHYYLSIRLINREFPNYQLVIPQKTTFNAKIDKGIFINAVRRIKVMSYEKSNYIKIKLRENEAEMLANHPIHGDAKEIVPISYSGKNMEIGFNAKLLIDMFSVFDEGEITLDLNNEFSQIIVKSQTLPQFLGIIMPIGVK